MRGSKRCNISGHIQFPMSEKDIAPCEKEEFFSSLNVHYYPFDDNIGDRLSLAFVS
jgi:hypothetical protein